MAKLGLEIGDLGAQAAVLLEEQFDALLQRRPAGPLASLGGLPGVGLVSAEVFRVFEALVRRKRRGELEIEPIQRGIATRPLRPARSSATRPSGVGHDAEPRRGSGRTPAEPDVS